MRPSVRLAIFVACGAALPAATTYAQTIRGRVVLADSATPVAGVVVTAIGPGDVTAATALSTFAGDYVLPLHTAGTYEVRAVRIGFRPTLVRGLVVAAGATIVQDITLSALPVAIAGMEIRGDGGCNLKGRDAQVFLELWEQARGALAATQLWEQSGNLDVRLVRVEGHIDAPESFADSLYPEVDTLGAREMIVDRAFAAAPPETVAVHGFVTAAADDRSVYGMPTPEILLSDSFVATHCFSIRSSGEHKEWIGVSFTPRRAVDGIADVRGVLWLERATAELRRVEFEYANLPSAEFHICDLQPFVPLTPERIKEVPPFQQPTARCENVKSNGSNKLGLGGYADFVRLPTGEWLVAEWLVRTPPDQGRIRPLPWRLRHVGRASERCYIGPDCRTVLAMRPRLATSGGTITAVSRGGARLKESVAGVAVVSAMAAKRAGDHPAALAGTVTNLYGHPLVNAVLQTEDPWRATQTDSAGAFQLRVLPAETLSVSVRCRGYRPVRFRLPLLGDSMRHVKVSMVRDDGVSSSTDCAAHSTEVRRQ